MAKKWIINDDELRVGLVDFHKELRTGKDEVPGGGFFHKYAPNVMLLYGESSDFGPVTIEEFSAASLSMSLERSELKFYFSEQFSLEDAIQDHADGKTTEFIR